MALSPVPSSQVFLELFVCRASDLLGLHQIYMLIFDEDLHIGIECNVKQERGKRNSQCSLCRRPKLCEVDQSNNLTLLFFSLEVSVYFMISTKALNFHIPLSKGMLVLTLDMQSQNHHRLSNTLSQSET